MTPVTPLLSTTFLALSGLLTLLLVASGGFCLACIYAIRRFFPRRIAASVAVRLAPVSLLVPVCGLDQEAEANWESLCVQEHLEYEVVFGLQQEDDPAVPVLRRVMARHPRRVRLIHCRERLGTNLQVSNLVQLVRAARYQTIIFADSDVRVTPDYLSTVTAPLADLEVGMVTCGYVDPTPRELGAAFSSMGRCIDFLPQLLIARWMDGRLRFALGPTIATRKDVLRRFGGLEQLVDRIGSDYHMGRLTAEAGFRVEISSYLLGNPGGQDSVQAVYHRELRWARTIRNNRGAQFYGMVITHALLLALLHLLVVGPQPWALGLAGAVLAARLAQALVAISTFRCPGLLRWLWALPLRDLMTALLWCVSLTGNQVRWRGRELLVGPGGTLRERRTAPRAARVSATGERAVRSDRAAKRKQRKARVSSHIPTAPNHRAAPGARFGGRDTAQRGQRKHRPR